MCGIVGYTGPRPCQEILLAGLEKLEYRGYDSAGPVAGRRTAASTRCAPSGNLQALRERDERRARSGAVSGIGHTRWATHGRVTEANCHPHDDTSGPRAHRAERHRRELDRPQEASCVADGAEFTLRDRRRGGRPPDRLALRRRPRRGRAPAPTTSCAATTRSCACTPTSPTCWSAPARSARWWSASARARTSSPRRSPPSWPTPAGSSWSRTTRSWWSPPRAPASSTPPARAVEREVEEVDWDEEAAEKGGYETFMLKEIHEQPDAVAETVADRLAHGTRRARRHRHHRRRAARPAPRGDRGLRHLLPRRADRPLRDRGVVARAGGDGRRLGVPLPRPGDRRARPGDRHLPVGRDGRHAGRHAPGAREGRQGAGRHQRDGQPGHARLRRRAVHPRRASRSAWPPPRPSSPRWPRCTCSR